MIAFGPVGHEDDGESFDAADHGGVEVPNGTAEILFAQQLLDLLNAGFPPGDAD